VGPIAAPVVSLPAAGTIKPTAARKDVGALTAARHPNLPRERPTGAQAHTVLAATNKCLAQSNKSGARGKATKKCEWLVDGPEYTNKPCDLDHRQR